MAHNIKPQYSQQQKILQKMVLTPQMMLSIRLLSMSMKDLTEYIDSAVEANPFLRKAIENKRSERSPSWDSYSSIPPEYTGSITRQDEDPRASLLSQLRMLHLDDGVMEIAEHLISEMDNNGYMPVALDELARDLFATMDEVESCLETLQQLDPPGIGARDVRECLQLQLKRMGKENSLEYSIVSDFITELARVDVEKISKALDADEEKVRNAIFNIKKLNPRPASTMLSERPQPVIPDMVARVNYEKIRLELNREWLPRLRLYNPYENKLDIVKDPETRQFMKENMNSARHLIDTLKRREETMCKVADYILNFHGHEGIDDEHGIKSLTTKDVSTALNLHPSTVNRTVSNKYIEINDKVVPLKSLLSHGIKKENGEIASKTSVKKKIEAIVKSEDKQQPLTDKVIQEKLSQEGIVIKRRTITKYRTALRILPTHLRRKK